MSLKKSLKKLGKNIKQAAKVAGRAAAKVVKYTAPFVGTLVAGPAGGLAGTALAGAASQVGPNKNRAKALKRTLVYGGAVTGAGMALGAISGAGLGASLLTSVPRLFGGGGSEAGGGTGEPEKSAGSSGLEEAFFTSPRASEKSGKTADFGALGGALLGSMFSGAGTGQTVSPMDPGDRGGGPFGDIFGVGGQPGEEKPGINPLWLVGGGVALLMLSKRKAG